MDDTIVRRMLRAYDITVDRILPVQKGYRNQSWPAITGDGRQLNLIIYKREPGIVQTIQRTNKVADMAAAAGLPVRTTADSRILQARHAATNTARYAALYNYLPGTTIPWEAYTMQHLKLLGASMSQLHAALQSRPADGLLKVSDVYGDIVARMRRYFGDQAVASAMDGKLQTRLADPLLQKQQHLLQLCAYLPHQQPLHMDFVRGNILYEGVAGTLRISGILDFEKTAVGHRLFDVARTLAFLLVDCRFKSEAEVRKYFLRSGYTKRGPLPFRRVVARTAQGPIDIFEGLVDLFLLYDFYKFCRHNPYESLVLNQHYVRTRDLLRRRGVLQ